MAENKVAEELRYVERYYTMRTPPVCAVAHIPTLVKEAAEEIERLEAENDILRGQRWIPVAEQMPDENATVEILDANANRNRATYHPKSDFPDNPWVSRPTANSLSLIHKNNVTHWRPIVYRPISHEVTEKLEPDFDISDFDAASWMEKGVNEILHEIGEGLTNDQGIQRKI